MLSRTQGAPFLAFAVHLWSRQSSDWHSLSEMQGPALPMPGSQAPCTHLPEPQFSGRAQGAPLGRGVSQTPAAHRPVQQSAPFRQLVPVGKSPPQIPSAQVLDKQSSLTLQTAPVGCASHFFAAEQVPEVHWMASAQGAS
jgi:hypothetical protein